MTINASAERHRQGVPPARAARIERNKFLLLGDQFATGLRDLSALIATSGDSPDTHFPQASFSFDRKEEVVYTEEGEHRTRFTDTLRCGLHRLAIISEQVPLNSKTSKTASQIKEVRFGLTVEPTEHVIRFSDIGLPLYDKEGFIEVSKRNRIFNQQTPIDGASIYHASNEFRLFTKDLKNLPQSVGRRNALVAIAATSVTSLACSLLGTGGNQIVAEPHQTSIPSAVPLAPKPSVTEIHSPDSNPTISSLNDIKPSEIIIDGEKFQVYGKDTPLNPDEFNSLLLQLQKEVDRGERKMDPDTLYLSLIVPQDAINNFPTSMGESYYSFVRRHVARFNEMLQSAPVPSYKALKVRDFFNVQNYQDGSLDSGPGFDGAYLETVGHDPSMLRIQDWDEADRISFVWLHEAVFHSALELGDHHFLNYYPTFELSVPSFLLNVPEVWREYRASGRPDISSDDLAASKPNLMILTSLLLERRVKNGLSHDQKDSSLDMLGWRPVLPSKVTFRFIDINGEMVMPKQIQIYRTKPHEGGAQNVEIFNPEPIYTGSGEGVESSSLLPVGENGVIDSREAILFFVIEGDAGKFFRWEDVRSFQIAALKGYENHVTFAMNAVSLLNDPRTPNNFSWEVKISRGDIP